MKSISLSGVLLLALITPFIMTYRLSPGETPFGLFGIIFGLLLGYFAFDLLGLKEKINKRVKDIILWLLVIVVIGSAYSSAILVRHRTAPGYQIHDIVLQQEAAIRFLLNGKNPYAVDYFGTPLEDWHYSDIEINPALFHLVMMPGYLLVALPFRLVSVPVLGFWDGRMPLLFLFIILLVLAWKALAKKAPETRRQLLALLAFNPATLSYFLEGRSDIFMFVFLFWAWYLLQKKRDSLAGGMMGLAFAVKQSVWPVFPFYLALLWCRIGQGDKLKKLFKKLWPFGVTFLVLVLPFAFWDPKAFWESTVLYLSGQAAHSYPISGYGWGMVLYRLGAIQDLKAYYPFWLWQLSLGLPLMILLLSWLIRRPGVKRLIAAYGVFTFVFWYFSRYFNNSHLAYLSMVFVVAYFWPQGKGLK